MEKRRDWDAVTFDCYGTLIDWESGIARAFAGEAERRGVSFERETTVRAYMEAEPDVEAGPFLPYHEVLAETARRVMSRLGWPGGDGRFLAESLPSWSPFPDTKAALARLAASGLRLGVLSNVDDALFAASRRGLAAEFDVVVTAQEVRAYKPARRHFEEARRRLRDVRWLHAAASLFHDVRPCRGAGIPVAWINRRGDARPEDGEDDSNFEFDTLLDLADFLVSPETYRIAPVAAADVSDVIRHVESTLGEFGIGFGEGCATDAELRELPLSYTSSGGRFWIARDPGTGALLGTCGVIPVAPGDYELRKMYWAPAARRMGLGKALLLRALSYARGRGALRMVLDTTEEMGRAIAFYEAHGFVRDDGQVRAARCARGYVLSF